MAHLRVLHVEQDLVDAHAPDLDVRWIDLDQIAPNPRQPRKVFDEDDLADLAASLREVGVLQPVVVRPVETGFELIMGERRCRAARIAGLAQVPALVREVLDADLLKVALLENLQRANLNPMEEGAAYQALMKDFGCTQEELARSLGVSRARISHYLGMLRLPASVQSRVAAGVLSAGHARALQSIRDPDVAERLAARIVAEGLSVRTVEELVALGDLPGWEDDVPRQRRTPSKPEQLREVAHDLADLLDTRVSVMRGQRRGRISIDFADDADLQRILDILRPH